LTDYLGGVSLDGAIEDVHEFNRSGVSCSLSYLPRVRHEDDAVQAEVREFRRAIEAIAAESLDADVTIKLQQLGIYEDIGLAESAVREIVATADEPGAFVWIDMELPDPVDATLEIHRRVSADHANAGICVQAYLKRTAADLERLLERRAVVRLVKGYYKEHDFSRWEEVTENYRRLMRRLIAESPRPAVATHDKRLIAEAREIRERAGADAMELQFFKGVRDELARELRREGENVRIYVPYGPVLGYVLDGAPTFDLWRQAQRLVGLRPRP